MSTTLNSTVLATPSREAAASGFIIGPLADSILIIGAPLVALVIAGPLFAFPMTRFTVSLQAEPQDVRQIFIAMFINAHLFLVFFRSHANPRIFWQFPLRFTAVPMAVCVLGIASPVVLGMMGVVAVWWDVYHSSLQTFGFGRIYDSKMHNDAAAGRTLDYWMNLLVYTGPVLAGAHLANHLNLSVDCFQFLSVDPNTFGDLMLQRTPAFLETNQSYLAAAILAIGIPYAVYYLYAYCRLHQQGYQVSWQKVWLLIITAAVSIYCWGFHSFIDAFWVMNFFHALQYFAIVLFAENRNLTQLFRVGGLAHGWLMAGFWVVSFSFLYGWWARFLATQNWSTSLALTTSLMHFWYDGFIWSVKKKQV